MKRAFTKALGRYKAGEVHDYPMFTWKQMAKAYGPLPSWSEPVNDARLEVVEISGRRGRVKAA